MQVWTVDGNLGSMVESKATKFFETFRPFICFPLWFLHRSLESWLIDPGLPWECGLPPVDQYTYTISESFFGHEETVVGKSRDDRVESLLKWIPQWKWFSPGKTVTCYEEDVYYVLEGPWFNKPSAPWHATVRVFSVWDQSEQTITFKVKKDWTTWRVRKYHALDLHVFFDASFGSTTTFFPSVKMATLRRCPTYQFWCLLGGEL